MNILKKISVRIIRAVLLIIASIQVLPYLESQLLKYEDELYLLFLFGGITHFLFNIFLGFILDVIDKLFQTNLVDNVLIHMFKLSRFLFILLFATSTLRLLNLNFAIIVVILIELMAFIDNKEYINERKLKEA